MAGRRETARPPAIRGHGSGRRGRFCVRRAGAAAILLPLCLGGASLRASAEDGAGPPGPAASSAPPTAPTGEDDCLAQLLTERTRDVDCSFPVEMTDEDRADIRRLTRDLFVDARCTARVSLARALVDQAMTMADAALEVPAQPVECEVETSRGNWQVRFTFTPKLELKAGNAVVATPGMGEVTGVNSWLAWPVVAWVNSSDSIEDVMLRVVNAARKRYVADAH